MDHISDQEQAAKIRVFWDETGKYLLLAVLVGLVLSFGWRYWKHRQVAHEQAASVLYMKLVTHHHGKPGLDQRVLTRLMTNHAHSVYAVMAQLDVAGLAVKTGHLDQAEQAYHWVLDHAKASAYRALASCRLARVLLADGQAEQALTLLSAVSDKAFVGQVALLKAQAYAQLGRVTEAASARKAAEQALSRRLPDWMVSAT